MGIFSLNKKIFKLHETTKETTRVPEISYLRAGNYSDSNKKEKTTSINKYTNDNNFPGVT